MKKHIGTMALACMVIFSLCMPVAKMESKTGGDTDHNDDGGYMFETILSRNEDIQGRPTYIEGYYKLYDDGLALYYSKQDYLYDTRENAVWLPERKDYPLEKMMAYATDFIYSDEQMIVVMAVIDDIGKENEYAATATYIDLENIAADPVYQNANHLKSKKEIKYREEEARREPLDVSFYRLVGDPWQFDGKKIRVECVKRYDDYVGVTRDFLPWGSTVGPLMMTRFFQEDEVLERIVNRHRRYGAKDSPDVYIPIATEEYHIFMTAMFYLYEPHETRDGEFLGYKMSYKYEMIDEEIHERDLDNYKKVLMEKE